MDEFSYWVRGETSGNPVYTASVSLQSGLPQKHLCCIKQIFTDMFGFVAKFALIAKNNMFLLDGGHPLFAARWLHPMKFAELLDLYEFMYRPEDTCGRTLLRTVYVQEWRSCLRIRKTSQHTQCKDCSFQELHRRILMFFVRSTQFFYFEYQQLFGWVAAFLQV